MFDLRSTYVYSKPVSPLSTWIDLISTLNRRMAKGRESKRKRQKSRKWRKQPAKPAKRAKYPKAIMLQQRCSRILHQSGNDICVQFSLTWFEFILWRNSVPGCKSSANILGLRSKTGDRSAIHVVFGQGKATDTACFKISLSKQNIVRNQRKVLQYLRYRLACHEEKWIRCPMGEELYEA